MYARQVAGKELTLAVSGMLWEMSLVMVDEETNSLWSHLLGEAMRGPLTGSKLTIVPSVITDWSSWRTTHPETDVVIMPRTTDAYTRDTQLEAEDLLIGLVRGKQSRAWLLSDLRKRSLSNDQLNGQTVLVAYDATTGTTVLYARTANEQILTFKLVDGRFVDHQTGSEWDLLTGTALTSTLKGVQLLPLEGIISSRYAWSVFHPESSYWQPEGD